MNRGNNTPGAPYLTSRDASNPGYTQKPNAMGDLILIIDDEPDICQLLQLSLSKQGYKVKYVHRLSEGMQFLERQQPDVLFLLARDVNITRRFVDNDGAEFFEITLTSADCAR